MFIYYHIIIITHPCKDHRFDACREAVVQLDQGHNTGISKENMNEQYGGEGLSFIT